MCDFMKIESTQETFESVGESKRVKASENVFFREKKILGKWEDFSWVLNLRAFPAAKRLLGTLEANLKRV